MLEAVLIGGPNGAGKTTFARSMLSALHPEALFLNVDEIQSEDRFSHPLAAGRELLRRLDDALAGRESFAIETTLSSRNYARRIPDWKRCGYRLLLHFIQLPSADYAVRRVRRRVAAGGHSIPEADVRRRHARGLILFQDVYKPLADDCYHWSSDDTGLRLVHHYER